MKSLYEELYDYSTLEAAYEAAFLICTKPRRTARRGL